VAIQIQEEERLTRTGRTDLAHRLVEAVRSACVDAAIEAYEQASSSGLCHEGAWEAAVSAIRMATLDGLAERAVRADSEAGADTPAAAESLGDVALRLARQFARPGAPAAGSAAAVTGAIAAGLLEWTAALSAHRGPHGFRKRGRSIASRGVALQASLSSAAQFDADVVERWLRTLSEGREVDPEESASSPEAPRAAAESAIDVAARCAQVTTLAAEVARDAHAAVRHDAAAALQLAASAAECALALAEQNLRSAVDTDWARNAKRRIWRTRLLLRRVRPAESARHDG
jgi:formiminotetrahydrofolate cyclodeaminase